jgi:phosphatidylinositol alpha-1,6-mannosyltransferase
MKAQLLVARARDRQRRKTDQFVFRALADPARSAPMANLLAVGQCPVPLRLLYVSSAGNLADNGGIETYGRELIRGMADRGHQVELVDASPASVSRDIGVSDFWPRRPFRRKYFFWRRFPHEDYRYHSALRRRSRAVIRAFQPDVVHSLHLYPWGAIVDGQVPAVVTAYGLEVEAIPPVLGSVRSAGTVHAISHYTAQLVGQLGSACAVRVLSWGIRESPAPAGARPPGETFDLITVCRLVRRKNVETVLRALQISGQSDVRYAVVGDGPELGALRELARTLGLSNVAFRGAVSEAEKQSLLSRSRLFVMCPLNEAGDVEGLGLVYFEAHAHGIPVVASTSGGVPDAVGDAGVLVDDPADPRAVGDAIKRALTEPEYAALRTRVLARQQSHSWTRFLDQFEKLYRDLAEQRRR